MHRVATELLGSLLLAATVIGSGIMAEHLAAGNAGVALLANTGATVAVLAVLIQLFGPISGAHFNPAVSLIQALRRAMTWHEGGQQESPRGICKGPDISEAIVRNGTNSGNS